MKNLSEYINLSAANNTLSFESFHDAINKVEAISHKTSSILISVVCKSTHVVVDLIKAIKQNSCANYKLAEIVEAEVN